MHFSLLQNASLFIQIHLIFALSAFALGAYQLATKKGTTRHKILGRAWVAMMVTICVTSFFIKEVMPKSLFWGYSPIHLISIYVLVVMSLGIYFAKKGNIAAHKRCMTRTYIGGLLIAGAFTFYPGRLLFRVFFS